MSLKNKVKILLFFILGAFCYGVIFYSGWKNFSAVQNASEGTFAESVQEFYEKPEDYRLILSILKAVEYDETDEAEEKTEEFLNISEDAYMNEYFGKLREFLSAEKKDRKPKYFFEEMGRFCSYFSSIYKESGNDSNRYSEVIPFYILKNYEKKEKDCVSLCETFLQNSTLNSNGYLTKKGAVVICLKIRKLYEDDGIVKNDERLKSIQNEITRYIQMYPDELEGSPVFSDEINWLRIFDSFLKDRIENPVTGIFRRISFNGNISGLGE